MTTDDEAVQAIIARLEAINDDTERLVAAAAAVAAAEPARELRDQLLVDLSDRGIASSRLAQLTGMGESAVRQAIARARGTAGKNTGRKGRIAGDLTAEFLHQAYVVEGRTQKDIAAEVGCSTMTVARWLERHQISRDERDQPDADELRRHYLDEGQTAAEIAAALDVAPVTVRRWLAAHGIRKQADGALDDAELRRLYVTEEHTAKRIAADHGLTETAVRARLHKAGIRRG